VVQLARAAGARAIVLGRDAARLARVAGLGADTVDTSARPEWEAALLERTGGQGVDLFVDVLGGPALARAIAATRVGGTISLFGFVQGGEATIDLVATIRRAVTLRASSGGSRASFEALVRALEAHAIVPIVDHVHPFSLDGVRAAFAQLEHGRPYGKVVIDVAGA
jgi:NADPH:quinone reductase-like Zn-dependent oxidoreductase